MHPIQFTEQNGVLVGPPDLDDCLDLPYHKGFDIQRQGKPLRTVTCCYELNKEEIEELVKTGKFYMVFYGRTIPPIMPIVENPFKLGIIKDAI